jgi:hypothetical protein
MHLRQFLKLLGSAFTAGLGIMTPFMILAATFGTPVRAQEPTPVYCDTPDQIKSYAQYLNSGSNATQAINTINAWERVPACMQTLPDHVQWGESAGQVLIGTQIYEMRQVAILVSSLLGPRWEYRFSLRPAREYGI